MGGNSTKEQKKNPKQEVKGSKKEQDKVAKNEEVKAAKEDMVAKNEQVKAAKEAKVEKNEEVKAAKEVKVAKNEEVIAAKNEKVKAAKNEEVKVGEQPKFNQPVLQVLPEVNLPVNIPLVKDPVPVIAPIVPVVYEKYVLRSTVCGNKGVGKSSLIERYINGKFSENNPPPETLSTSFINKEDVIVGSKSIKIIIMDTPGSTDITATTSTLSRQAFVLLVYDVTNRDSFESLHDSIEQFNYNNTNPKKLLIIVGNKADEGSRTVDEYEARALAESHGVEYCEVSVKKGSKIDQVFYKAIQSVCKNIDEKAWGENFTNLEKYGITKKID